MWRKFRNESGKGDFRGTAAKVVRFGDNKVFKTIFRMSHNVISPLAPLGKIHSTLKVLFKASSLPLWDEVQYAFC